MHEMSLAAGILHMVEQAAQREHFSHVRRLHLEAGALAGVEVQALRFALQTMTAQTCLADAEIVIDQPAGQAVCMACGETAAIVSRLDACPHCGGYRLQPTGGTDLRVVELIVTES